jgi:hypothetical protein
MDRPRKKTERENKMGQTLTVSQKNSNQRVFVTPCEEGKPHIMHYKNMVVFRLP